MSERINLKITLVHVHIVYSVEHMVRSQYVPIMSQFMWLESPMPAPSFPMSLPQLQETQCVYGCQAPLDINKSAGIAGVAATNEFRQPSDNRSGSMKRLPHYPQSIGKKHEKT